MITWDKGITARNPEIMIAGLTTLLEKSSWIITPTLQECDLWGGGGGPCIWCTV